MEATEKQLGRSLGELLRHYRELCNVTQEFVASQLNVSRQSVSKWELGLAIPSTSNLFALAKLYNIPIEVLLDARRYSEEMAAENDVDIELNYDEGEGGENEDADADKSNKMSRKTKRVLALCAIITALAFLVSTVVSINIHNRNYYSNILNISEEQLNKFIESEPDVREIDLSERQTEKDNLFFNDVNIFMSNFLEQSKVYDMYFLNEYGKYYISENEFTSSDEAENIFSKIVLWREDIKLSSSIDETSSCASFIFDDKTDTYVYIWCNNNRIFSFVSEKYESGNEMLSKLINYVKERKNDFYKKILM